MSNIEDDNDDDALSLSNLKFDLDEPQKNDDDNGAYDEEYWSGYEMCSICGKVMNGSDGPHETDFVQNEVVNVHPNDQSKKHMFHRGCILEWCEKKSNCPICRSNINCEKLEWQKSIPVYELIKKGGRRKRKTARKHKRRTHKKRTHKRRTHRRHTHRRR